MAAGSCRFYVILGNAKDTLYGLLLVRNLCRQLHLSTSYGILLIPHFYHLENYKKKAWDIVGKTTRTQDVKPPLFLLVLVDESGLLPLLSELSNL
jgi:hypothetical protein